MAVLGASVNRLVRFRSGMTGGREGGTYRHCWRRSLVIKVVAREVEVALSPRLACSSSRMRCREPPAQTTRKSTRDLLMATTTASTNLQRDAPTPPPLANVSPQPHHQRFCLSASPALSIVPSPPPPATTQQSPAMQGGWPVRQIAWEPVGGEADGGGSLWRQDILVGSSAGTAAGQPAHRQQSSAMQLSVMGPLPFYTAVAERPPHDIVVPVHSMPSSPSTPRRRRPRPPLRRHPSRALPRRCSRLQLLPKPTSTTPPTPSPPSRH
jgi:hypothetical protein